MTETDIKNDWNFYLSSRSYHGNDVKQQSLNNLKDFMEFSKINSGWMPLWKLEIMSQNKQKTASTTSTIDKTKEDCINESKILTNISFLAAFLLKRSPLNNRSAKKLIENQSPNFKIVEPFDVNQETFAYQKDGEWYRMSVFHQFQSLSDMESEYRHVTEGSDFWVDRRTI